MATSQTWPVTFGSTVAPLSAQSLSSTLTATPLSRSSSSSSDLQSVSSATSIGLAGEVGLAVKSLSPRQDNSPEALVISSTLMASRSTSVEDEPGSQSSARRLSGRARKLTAKYQALHGTKLLPVNSPNTVSQDACSPTNAPTPDEISTYDDGEHRTSTTNARTVSPPKQPSPALAEEQSSELENAGTESDIAMFDDVEEDSKRSSRRERKPTARLLQSTTASVSRKRSLSPTKEASPSKVLRLTVQPPKRPSKLRHALPPAGDKAETPARPVLPIANDQRDKEHPKDEPKSFPVEDTVPRPSKIVILRYKRQTGTARKPPDSALPNIEGQQDDSSRETRCELKCMSPASSILMYAKFAAESFDNDDEKKKRENELGHRIPSRELYEKWLADNWKRFCVCNRTENTHAHPPGVETSAHDPEQTLFPNGVAMPAEAQATRPNAADLTKPPMPLPTVNKTVSSSDARRVSATYNTFTHMTENPATNSAKARDRGTASLQARFVRSATPSPEEARARAARDRAHAEHKKDLSESREFPTATSFEEREREDRRALGAIRQQALMEGVKIKDDMGYDQIKTLLDARRIKASKITTPGLVPDYLKTSLAKSGFATL